MLDRIDLLGVYTTPGEGPPPGEYVDLIDPLLRLLREDISEGGLAEWLGQHLFRDYGLGKGEPDRATARTVRDWWKQRGT